MEPLDQWPCFIIYDNSTPDASALDVEADQVEGSINILGSTPAKVRTPLFHL